MNAEPTIKKKAGVIAWRPAANGQAEVLLITARSVPNSWIFPSGTWEAGEALEETAARECAEESGYTVEVGDHVSNFDIVKDDGSIHRVSYFVARQVGELPDYETDRQRKWVPQNELDQHVSAYFAPITKLAMQQKLG